MPPAGGDSSLTAARAWVAHLRDVRAALEGALGDGRATLGEIAARRADPAVGAVRVRSLLEALPGARKVDTRRELDRLGVPGRRPLGELSEGDLTAILARFPLGAS